MTDFSRRRFLEASAALAALAPLSGVEARGAVPADAVAQAAALRAGKVGAAALVEAAIARLEQVNRRLNAVAHPDFDAARARAGAPGSGPLAGVPILIKDNLEQAGLPFTNGCRALRTRTGKADDPSYAAIAAAGLNSIGRSTLPEFGLLPTSEALLTGPTRNPWSLDHSSGGSSGGSAAAVAAGVVAVAHANDGGGSIRIPASCCNLVGLKPSRARLTGETGRRKVTDFGVQGCVSRTVRDTAAWFAALEATGPDAVYPPVGLVTGPGKARLRIGLLAASADGVPPDDDVMKVFETARWHLERRRHRIVDARPAFDGKVVGDAFSRIWSNGAGTRAKAAATFLGRPVTDADVEPLTLSWAAHGAQSTPEQLGAAVAALRTLEAQYTAQFDGFDVLMTPVLATPPVRIGELDPVKSYDDLDAVLRRYVAYTPVENAAGAPAISLPIGFSRDKLPIGIQLVARPGGERVLLELAYELEREIEWHRLRPPVWAG